MIWVKENKQGEKVVYQNRNGAVVRTITYNKDNTMPFDLLVSRAKAFFDRQEQQRCPDCGFKMGNDGTIDPLNEVCTLCIEEGIEEKNDTAQEIS